MVDALGRWVTLLSTIRINVSGFNIFCELYLSDFSFRKIYAELSEGGKRKHFILVNDYLFHGLHLYIPICSLHKHIICEWLCKGHFKWVKTLALAYYYWPKLPSQIFNFVKKCVVCERSKETLSNDGLYTILPILDAPWLDMSMNFVLGLPHTQWVTYFIFVVVDKFSKMVMERPWMHLGEPNFNFNEMVCLHGIPSSITLNRNVKLMSNF